MFKRMQVFFSGHAWKCSFIVKRFFINWVATFSIVWTFVDFIGFFFENNGKPWSLPLWLVLVIGVLLALWMSRPRLLRTVKLPGKDITLQITVNDMFNINDGTVIIPANRLFKHDHMDNGAIQIQFRNKYFTDLTSFDSALQIALEHETYDSTSFQGKEMKMYPLGTVARLQLPKGKINAAYIVATTELNEYGRAIPNRDQLREALEGLWQYISQRGKKEHLIIPILGSGRHRLNVNRFELINDIVKTFLKVIEHNKFTEKLTIVIHPDAFLRNRFNLEEVEEYLNYVSKFETEYSSK